MGTGPISVEAGIPGQTPQVWKKAHGGNWRGLGFQEPLLIGSEGKFRGEMTDSTRANSQSENENAVPACGSPRE